VRSAGGCGRLAALASLALLACSEDVAEPAATQQPAQFRGCLGPSEAHAVVDAFWSELDRHYAVFDLRLQTQTWGEVGREACESIGARTTPDALFEEIWNMARALNDGHIQIRAQDLGRRETGWVSVYPYGAEMARLREVVETRYSKSPLSTDPSGVYAWGWITLQPDERFAYLDLRAFEGLSAESEELADVAAARAAMERAVREVGGAVGLVVDLRNNEGGWDAVGLETARWFDGPRSVAYTKARRRAGASHDEFGHEQPVWVEASPARSFRAPVVVLTSGWTFSAAETFVLSMRTRRRVVQLGETTSGHFSDLEPALLPNGWSYTYSAERYRAADSEVYEARGIAPDIDVEFDPEALSAGRDPQLEAALDSLRSEPREGATRSLRSAEPAPACPQ
jgi:hypothetical protein